MSKFSTDSFVQEKIDIEDAGASVVFGKPKGVETFSPRNGRIIFIGMPGSGRLELAERVAARLGMRVLAPETVNSLQELDVLCTETGTVLVIPCEALRNESIRSALRDKGKVFYLMAEVLRMAYRLNQTSEPEKEAISALFVEMEPLCMMSLHFILQAWKEPEEIVDNVLEMLNISKQKAIFQEILE